MIFLDLVGGGGSLKSFFVDTEVECTAEGFRECVLGEVGEIGL